MAGSVGLAQTTYRADIHDRSVHITDDFLSAISFDPPVIPQALQEIVLDISYIDQIGDLLQKSLSLLSSDIGREYRGVGPGPTQVFDSAAKREREGTLREAELYFGRLEESLRLSVVFPKQVSVGEIVGRLALQICDNKWGVGL